MKILEKESLEELVYFYIVFLSPTFRNRLTTIYLSGLAELDGQKLNRPKKRLPRRVPKVLVGMAEFTVLSTLAFTLFNHSIIQLIPFFLHRTPWTMPLGF